MVLCCLKIKSTFRGENTDFSAQDEIGTLTFYMITHKLKRCYFALHTLNADMKPTWAPVLISLIAASNISLYK